MNSSYGCSPVCRCACGWVCACVCVCVCMCGGGGEIKANFSALLRNSLTPGSLPIIRP